MSLACLMMLAVKQDETVPSSTGAPALSVASGTLGKIGVEIDLSDGAWSVTPDEVEYRWRREGVGLIDGQTANALTPAEAMDGWSIRGEVRVQLTAGEWSDWAVSAYQAITYYAPVATPGTWEEDENTGVQTYDASARFTVEGDADLSGITLWGLNTEAEFLGMDGSNVEADTDESGPLAGFAVKVRAVNSGGEAEATITLDVAAEDLSGKIHNLVDDFPGSSFHAQWGLWGDAAVSGGSGNIPVNGDFNDGFGSTATWDLTESQIVFRASFTDIRTWTSGKLDLVHDTNNRFEWGIADNTLNARMRNGSASWTTLRSNVTYDGATHQYFRVRHTGSTVYFEWSTDGESWTEYTNTSAHTFPITGLAALFYAGDWQTSPALPGGIVFHVQSVNILPEEEVEVLAPTVYRPWMVPAYFRTGTGVWAVDAAQLFEGGEVETWSIVGPKPDGVTIDPGNGRVFVPTTAQFGWMEINVRGANAEGHADLKLELRVVTPTHTLSGGAAFNTISPGSGSKIWIDGGTYTTMQNIGGWGGSSGNPTEIFGDLSNRPLFNAAARTDYILFLNNANDLHLRGLDFVDDGGCIQAFYTNTGVRNRFEQLSISGFRKFAFTLGWTSQAVRNHVIRYCNIFGNTRENRKSDGTGGQLGSGGWGRGIAGDTSGGTTVRRCWVHENWGEGIGTLGVEGADIRENYVWDNYSVNIYNDNTAYAIVTENYIWSNNPQFYKGGSPAATVANSNEPLGSPYERPTIDNAVTGNHLGGGAAPHYFSSPGAQYPGSGGSVYTPNFTLSAINPKWKLGPEAAPAPKTAFGAMTTADNPTVPAGCPAGAIIFVAQINSSGMPGDEPTGYTEFLAEQYPADVGIRLSWKVAAGTEGGNATSGAGSSSRAIAFWVTGLDQADPIGATAFATSTRNGAPSTYPTPALPTVDPRSWLLSVIGSDATNAVPVIADAMHPYYSTTAGNDDFLSLALKGPFGAASYSSQNVAYPANLNNCVIASIELKAAP